MKRKFLIVMFALIVAIASAFALTACGETNGNGGSNTGNIGNGDNNGNTTVVTPGGDTTVTTPETPDSGDNDNQGGSGNTGGGNKDTDDNGNGDNTDNTTVVTPPGGGNKDTDDNDNPEKPATEGLKYTLLADDAYEVTGYDGIATEINIPSTYNGKPVTSIGDNAINSERDFRKTQQKTPNNIENSLQMIA